ncbi:MAG: O-acetyl-ADP-ribose deacetylase [Siphonobacter sp.]
MIEVIQGDITQQHVDGIVNAANSSLVGGSGVDGAIHRVGGPAILQECEQIRNRQGECSPGEAVITTAGNLPAKKVIHTVGPVWNGGRKKEAEALANCYRNSLKLAMENGLRTIAFPNISTGIYGYPKNLAAPVAVYTVETFLENNPKAFDRVVFVCFDSDNMVQYRKLLPNQIGV